MNYTLDSLFGVKDEVIVVCGGTRGIGGRSPTAWPTLAPN